MGNSNTQPKKGTKSTKKPPPKEYLTLRQLDNELFPKIFEFENRLDNDDDKRPMFTVPSTKLQTFLATHMPRLGQSFNVSDFQQKHADIANSAGNLTRSDVLKILDAYFRESQKTPNIVRYDMDLHYELTFGLNPFPFTPLTRDELNTLETKFFNDYKYVPIDSEGNLDTSLLKVKKSLGSSEELINFSIYTPADDSRKHQIRDAAFHYKFADPSHNYCLGALFGLVAGDALGAPVEFQPVRYDTVDFEDMQSGGKFGLWAGQWTDDSAMALCIADSLIFHGKFHPADMKLRFVYWWQYGYNNAFRCENVRGSVGLGGNISQSFLEFAHHGTLYTQKGDKNTSGNGSLMRLAPIPIFFRKSYKEALRVSRLSSLLTHQGIEAEQCCSLLAHILVRLIEFQPPDAPPAEKKEKVLGNLATEWADFESALPSVQYLARSMAEPTGLKNDPPNNNNNINNNNINNNNNNNNNINNINNNESESEKTINTETSHQAVVHNNNESNNNTTGNEKTNNTPNPDRNWTWRSPSFRYSPSRASKDPGYIGSYCMDALSMALHLLWTTSTFSQALVKAANLRGDADTVAAVVGQMAGALYGWREVPVEWVRKVGRWDCGGEVLMRVMDLVDGGVAWRQLREKEKEKEGKKRRVSEQ